MTHFRYRIGNAVECSEFEMQSSATGPEISAEIAKPYQLSPGRIQAEVS